MIVRRLYGLLIAAALFAPAPANADCVQCSCGIETSGLVFGPYNPRRPTSGSVATVRVTCDGDSGYLIKMSAGSSGTPTGRTLHNGASILNYNLYKDAGRSMIWGDGAAGQTGLMGSGTANYNVYGAIFGGQAPLVGVYTDTLILSVEY